MLDTDSIVQKIMENEDKEYADVMNQEISLGEVSKLDGQEYKCTVRELAKKFLELGLKYNLADDNKKYNKWCYATKNTEFQEKQYYEVAVPFLETIKVVVYQNGAFYDDDCNFIHREDIYAYRPIEIDYKILDEMQDIAENSENAKDFQLRKMVFGDWRR